MTTAGGVSKYEGCGEIGSIRAIFLSQFHPVQGPMIRCQWPPDFLSKELFDSLSSFIIPKNELQAHTITVNCHGYKISGYPTYLHDKKYPRNYLLFNLCIVSFPWSRTVQFEPVVRKLSQFFVNLEKEKVLLSGCEGDELEEIERMLKQVYTDLNTVSSVSRCEVVCGQNSLQLSVKDSGHNPPSVSAHHVPILLATSHYCPDQWDLTTTQIMPHIDGFNHIAKISSLADVGTSLVVACVQNLVYHKVLDIISIFQYSNVYTVTQELTKLRNDPQFRQDVIETAGRKDISQPPKFRDIFTFISSFSHGTTVKDVCQRMCPVKLGLHEARLVQYCVMRGVLRRVHRYPVMPGDTGPALSSMATWFTGEHNTDQICVGAGISAAALDKRIEEENVNVICK